jgi:protein pelota
MDLKNDAVKLRVDDLDDLWAIYNTVEVGDLALAKTFRREKMEREDSRPERGEKKPVFLGVRVEKVEFHKYVNMIRLIGRIERGVDLGSYHALNIEPGSVFTVIKSWKRAEIATLKEAVRETKRPVILVVALEEGDATFAIIRQRGVDFLSEVSANIPGKREKGPREALRREFYSAVLKGITETASSRGLGQVLVVGPDLTRAGFKRYVEESPDLGSIKVSFDTCFSPGRTGVYEAIRRGAVDRVVSSSRVSLEMSEVEDFLQEVARDGRAAYGPPQVKEAAGAGAVEKLLVTDEFFRERRAEAVAVIRQVERYQGSHLMISTDHEAGVKLQSLGGLGATLRYDFGRPQAPGSPE